jgi:hypothetical protein
MKHYLLLLIFSIGVQGWIHAQSTDTTTRDPDPGYQTSPNQKKVSPLQRATRQLTVLQDKLNLNQNQVIKLRMILLNANISLDSLHSNPSGDQKADNKSRRAILQDADMKTYALLNTDQQLLYAQWKVERKQKQKQKQQQ